VAKRPVFGSQLAEGLIAALGELELVRGHLDAFRLASARYDMGSLARQIHRLASLADALARDLERPRYDA
jgi:hypothetical protein